MREAAADGVDAVILNPSGVFGPRDYRLTPATRAIVGMLSGDPSFLGVCLTDVRDAAKAHVAAAAKGKRGERYLITGDRCTPSEVAQLFADVAGVRPMQLRPPTFLLRRRAPPEKTPRSARARSKTSAADT